MPDSIRSKQPIPIGVFNQFPPQNFTQDGKLVGYDVDLEKAVAEVLGLKFKLIGVPWDAIIPGMQSGRFAGTFSSMNPTPERLQTLDAVPFSQTGSLFITPADSKVSIKTKLDVCGLTVGSTAGSNQLAGVKEISDDCVAAGKEKVTIRGYPGTPPAVLALKSGRIDAYSQSGVSLTYLAQQSNGEIITQPYRFLTTPSGAGFPKGSELAQPVADAINDLIKNGTYAAILKKWGVPQIAVEEVSVVTAANSK